MGIMSTEKIIKANEKDVEFFMNPQNSNKKSSGRVDINNLLARVRLKNAQERKTNLIFFSLFAALIFVLITILSF
jgi:hypothetical protein|tara:strand:+ start:317 stop:541 length:225 start_codon:yes stop_codon:yes gene_type:complete